MTSRWPALTWAVLSRLASWMATMPSLTDRPGQLGGGDLGERLATPDGHRALGLDGPRPARAAEPEERGDEHGRDREEDEPPARGEPQAPSGRRALTGTAGKDDQLRPAGAGGQRVAEVGGLPGNCTHHVLHPGGQGHRRTGVR